MVVYLEANSDHGGEKSRIIGAPQQAFYIVHGSIFSQAIFDRKSHFDETVSHTFLRK